jgi:ferredoxin--NADP+ reductase
MARTRPRVAIIGAGPAGAFAAASLLRARGDVEIDLFERLPTPWGPCAVAWLPTTRR